MMNNFATERQQPTVDPCALLWCRVIEDAVRDSQTGNVKAQLWFQQSTSIYWTIARFLNLPGERIAARALNVRREPQTRRRGPALASNKPRKVKGAPPVTKIESTWTSDLSTIGWTQRTPQ
jgi:hypothetical protein